ncbi:unnamed protein product [Cunninghamella blakesleeana]
MSKKVTVFILNCNPSMGIQFPNNEKTAFQEGIDVIIDSIGEKVLANRKTDRISVILSGTRETNNALAEETGDQYQHITTFCEIKQADTALLRNLVNVTVSDSNDNNADIMDALILATHMISEECGRTKCNKQIVLITDTVDEIDWRDTEDVINMFKGEDIKLVVIGAGFDKHGLINGEHIEDDGRLEIKKVNQENWKTMIESIPDGLLYSLKEAYEASQGLKTKEVRPTPMFKGFLFLGDNETYGTRALTSSISMFSYTVPSKAPLPKKWSTLSDLNLTNRPSTSSASENTFQQPTHGVQMEKRYRIKHTSGLKSSLSSSLLDSSSQMDTVPEVIDENTLEKAYQFGKSLVQVTKEEEDMLVLPTKPGLWIHSFYKKSAIPQKCFSGTVYTIVAGSFDTQISGTIISALARSLYERDEVALVRFVNKPYSTPKMGVVFPYIDVDTNVLQFCQVPFSEDIRQFTFPSLDKVITKSGTVLTEGHPLLPDKEMKDSMSAFVKSMDLTEFSKDNNEQFYTPEDNYNPLIWLTNTAIKTRALNDAAPVPKLNSKLKQQFDILPDLFKQNDAIIKKMEDSFNVKKVNKDDTKNRRYGEINELNQAEKLKSIEDVIGNTHSFDTNMNQLTLSSQPSIFNRKENEDDTDMIFLQHVSKKNDTRKITTETPIEDFNAMIQNPNVDLVTDAVTQMSELILQLMTTSFGDQNYEKTIRCLKVLREVASKENEAKLFNHCLQQLKQLIDLSNPDALHLDFWQLLQKQNISLITHEEADDDEVVIITKEDAYKFLHEAGNNTQNNSNSIPKQEDEFEGITTEDLLAMMD